MPSKKRKPKTSQAKSKNAPSKQARKASRRKIAVPPKKTVKKKQLKTKSPKGSSTRKRKTQAQRTPRLKSSSAREGVRSLRRSGDLESVSRVAQADSESVDELVEEGNVFEAGAVAGVEEADDQDTREVHTHEVPEDDVPDEYLDRD